MTLQGINRINDLFWRKERKNQERLMANEANLEIALDLVKAEYATPTYFVLKRSYGTLLHQANTFRTIALKEQASKGGKASKTGPLQKLIIRAIKQNPAINEHKLYLLLKKHPGVRIEQPSETVAGEPPMVHFMDKKCEEESAQVSGLKDRLYRAKKSFRAKR